MQENSTLNHKHPLLLLIILLASTFSFAQVKKKSDQNDSLLSVSRTHPPGINIKDEEETIKKHSPRTAAIRSAIFPGLGQIYNKKYWKQIGRAHV